MDLGVRREEHRENERSRRKEGTCTDKEQEMCMYTEHGWCGPTLH